MEKLRRDYPDIAPAGPSYSRGVKCGNMLFVSGCTARGTSAQGAAFVDQLRVTLDRVVRIVESEGGRSGDIVKITTFVTSMADYRAHSEGYHAVFSEYFEGENPANTLVEITALAEDGLDIEIEAIAMLD